MIQDKLKITNEYLYRWLMLGIIDGVTPKTILRDFGYKSIALYGYTGLCIALLNELKDSDISVKYLMDRRGNEIDICIPVYKLEECNKEFIDQVDAVIICLPVYEKELRLELNKKYGDKVIDIGELLYEVRPHYSDH